MNNKPDQSFDTILDKFDRNIYGSSKGKLRHELLLHYLLTVLDLRGHPLNIIDVGAGTGVMTQAMLDLGHQVTFNDLSQESVEIGKKKLGGYSNVDFLQGTLSELSRQSFYDVVICHAVLEWLQNPYDALQKMIGLVKPGGSLSLSFFNLDAHRFGNVLYGNFDYVLNGMPRKNNVRLNPNNALPVQDVLAKLAEFPVEIIHTAGIRCFHDYLKIKQQQVDDYDKLKQLEMLYGLQAPYKWLGKYFHIIVRIP